MAIHPDLLSLASTTVEIEPLVSVDAGRGPSYGAKRRYPAHVDYTRRKLVQPNGLEVVAQGTIYVLSSTARIGEHDRITLPGTTRHARVLAVSPVRDEQGVHHWEIDFG